MKPTKFKIYSINHENFAYFIICLYITTAGLLTLANINPIGGFTGLYVNIYIILSFIGGAFGCGYFFLRCLKHMKWRRKKFEM